ncbi:MAG: antibiotic biosynthesis monooxygenase [Streptosporangiaceae bacterium]
MSLPVLIGFAGVLVAAVATGMLAGRWVRRPRIDFIIWTAATLALMVALVAQSMGFVSGFDQGTFRAAQLGAQLLAPLWIGWGLIELVSGSEAVRFAARLLAGALTVVASVILATDPLTSQTFGKDWPPAGRYFQPISIDAVDAVQAVAVVAVLAGVIMAVAGAGAVRNPRRRAALAAVVPAGLAVLAAVAMRFSLPYRAGYPLLSVLTAVLVWFGATRVRNPAGRASQNAYPEAGGRDEQPSRDNGDWPGDDDGSPDDKPHDENDVANGDTMADGDQSEDGDVADGQYELYGQRGPLDPAGQRGAWDPGAQDPGGPNGRAYSADPLGDAGLAAAGLVPGADGGALRADGVAAGASGQAAGNGSRPYGRILIFTLLDDRVDDFDRLAEQAAEAVMVSEPDTLVYVIHLVPNAPMQRIFYEIYRDRPAFDHHESQSYMQRFVAERRSCVLATNVIELRLKFAKVAPLPGPQAAAPPSVQAAAGAAGPAGPAPGAGSAQPSGPLPRLQPLSPDPYLSTQGPRGPQGTQRPQPSQPARAQYAAPSPYHDQPPYQGNGQYSNGQYGSGQYPAQAQYPGGEYAGAAPYPEQRYPGQQPGDQPRTDQRAADPWRTAQHRPDPLRDPLPPDGPRRNDPLRPDPLRPDPLRPGPLQGDPRRTDSWRPTSPPDGPRRGDPLRPDPLRPDPLRPDPLRPDPLRPGPLQGDPRRTDSWRASPPSDGWQPGDRRTGEWRTDESWSPGPQRPDQPDQPRPEQPWPDQPRPGQRRTPSAGRPNGSG